MPHQEFCPLWDLENFLGLEIPRQRSSEEKGKGAPEVFFEAILIFFWKEIPSQLSAQPEHNWAAMPLVPERRFLSAFFQLVSHVPCSECQCSYKETAIRQGDCQEQEPSALSVYQGVCLCLSVAYSIFQKLSFAPCHPIAPCFLCHPRNAMEQNICWEINHTC